VTVLRVAGIMQQQGRQASIVLLLTRLPNCYALLNL